MTSKLVVNTIEADTGISSVSFASSISMDSTSKFHFSAAGVDIGADTNINRPAAGVLGFNINGSQKVVITSNGRLGIGTNNPTQLIEVQNRSTGTVCGLNVGTQYGNAHFGGYNNYPAIMNSGNQPLIYCDTNNDRTVLFGDTVGFGTTCAFRVNGAERARIDSSGRLLVGAGAIANPKSSGAGSIDLDNQAFSIMVGGNHPSGGRSNNNAKTFRMSMVHYALAEEPINILQGYCDSSDNNVYIGGGTGSANSLTSVRIYTGANTTTTGGTERFRIHSAGQIGLSGANYGSAGQVLTSQGSGSAPTWAAAGITMADQWRIDSSFTLGGSVSTLTSNWERVDTTGRGILGGAMTQSSGVFTFPATGIYLIEFVCSMSSTSALRYVGHRIQTTTNNSSYAHATDVLGNCGLTNSFGAHITTSSSVIFDVTDTSQCKVRFAGVSITSSVTSVLGDSGRNHTFATFTRLGDT